MALDFSTKLAKCQLTTFILICLGNFFNFIAILTPNWQVIYFIFISYYLFLGGDRHRCWEKH